MGDHQQQTETLTSNSLLTVSVVCTFKDTPRSGVVHQSEPAAESNYLCHFCVDKFTREQLKVHLKKHRGLLDSHENSEEKQVPEEEQEPEEEQDPEEERSQDDKNQVGEDDTASMLYLFDKMDIGEDDAAGLLHPFDKMDIDGDDAASQDGNKHVDEGIEGDGKDEPDHKNEYNNNNSEPDTSNIEAKEADPRYR